MKLYYKQNKENIMTNHRVPSANRKEKNKAAYELVSSFEEHTALT